MPYSALPLLCTSLIEKCYSTQFLADPSSVTAVDLGLEYVETIYGADFGVRVPYGIIAKSATEIFVSLRGTWDLDEWEEDFRFGFREYPNIESAKVEAGFYAIYKSLVTSKGDSFMRYLADLVMAEGKELIVTGHSLGAALASIVAGVIGAKHLVTYGSPMVGNFVFTTWLSDRISNVYRYANAHDFVTKVPVSQLGYCHIGSQITLYPEGISIFDLSGNHILPTYIKALSKDNVIA